MKNKFIILTSLMLILITLTSCINDSKEVINFQENEIEWAVRKAINKHEAELTVADLEKVVHLDINLNKNTNLSELNEISNLSSLSLKNITTEQLKQIEGVSSLKKLQIESNYPITINDNSIYEQLINLSITTEGPIDISGLKENNSLQYVYLHAKEVKKVKNIGYLKNAEDIVIDPVGKLDITNLQNLDQLKRLYLSNGQLLNSEKIQHLPSLEELGLKAIKMDDTTWTENMKQLKQFYINND